ncbi:hypothetical protein E4U34_000946 [Claviceps purpurea]|nr:hypothetical protein E4U34_000946 [Claviceps purpurea]KAG6280175.1 hypothetical protein E4U48_008037 [Claviceps purpurea]
MAEDVSPDAPPPPVGSTNRSKPHSKLMATGQCHPRPDHLRLLIPSSPPHQRLASSPRVIKTSSTLSQPHTSTANYQETSLLPQSPRPARHGIQTLLDAEREASKIVQKAREFRTKRVREARDEAKQEIADYKAKKEDEFQKFGAEHSKGNEQAEAEASKEADKHIKTIKEAGSKGQASVVKNLLSAVFDVKPVAPAKQ